MNGAGRKARVTLVAACALLVLSAPSASAAGPPGEAGEATLTFAGAATERLDRERVTILGIDGPGLSMPISGGTVGSIAQMDFSEPITLRSRSKGKKREATLTELEGTLGSDRSFVTAKLAGTQHTLWTLKGVTADAYDPLTGEVSVDDAAVKVNRAAAAAIDRRLGTSGALRRQLGTLAIDAMLEPVEQGLESPPLLERPAGAADVSEASVTWRYRESFVDYIHAGGETSGIMASDGATPGPEEIVPPSTEPRVYEFGYSWAAGWSDSPGASGETTGLYFDGKVNIAKPIAPFGIDLDAQDVEVELNGNDSRLIALLDGRLNNADQVNRRAVAVDLDLADVTPTAVDEGPVTTFTYEEIPATVPDGNDTWPIADFYPAGSDWGWVTVSYSVPDVAP